MHNHQARVLTGRRRTRLVGVITVQIVIITRRSTVYYLRQQCDKRERCGCKQMITAEIDAMIVIVCHDKIHVGFVGSVSACASIVSDVFRRGDDGTFT